MEAHARASTLATTIADLVIRNGRFVYADGTIVAGDIHCVDGSIASVTASGAHSAAAGSQEIDAEGRHVLPGAIDPHVQFPPVGDFDHYATETGSAALGGVTTVLKMHRDLAGYDAAWFREELDGAERRSHIDFAFHLSLMDDDQIARAAEYAVEFDTMSFKLFIAYKGDEGRERGIGAVDDGQLLEAFEAIAQLGATALVHCENHDIATRRKQRVVSAGRDDLSAFHDSRPPIAEAEAVQRAALLARHAGCSLYVVHVSAKESLEYLINAKASGQEVFVETTPHYLVATCETSAGNLAKVAPPIRTLEHTEALWQGLAEGRIDTIGSDHVATSRASKQGTVWEAELGLPGVATILPLLLSEGVNQGRISLGQLVAATSTNSARIFGLGRKGALIPGNDADLVVVDLDLERDVSAEILGSAADQTIYEGQRLRGWPVLTVCRGEVVARDGELVGPEGHGRFIRRPIAA